MPAYFFGRIVVFEHISGDLKSINLLAVNQQGFLGVLSKTYCFD